MVEDSRKVSLERLASPEQIDRLLVIVRVPGWIALWCLVALVVGAIVWAFLGSIPITADGTGVFFDPRDIHVVQSDAEGVVDKVEAAEGDFVEEGAPLLGVSKRTVPAPFEGTVLAIDVLLGERVEPGTTLLWFHAKPADEEHDLVYAFFPIGQGELIRKGMEAHIIFDGISVDKYGKLEGRVRRVLPFATSRNEWILRSLPSGDLRTLLRGEMASLIVEVEPVRDPNTATGLKWTRSEGPPFDIAKGSVGQVTILVETKRPISYLIRHG